MKLLICLEGGHKHVIFGIMLADAKVVMNDIKQQKARFITLNETTSIRTSAVVMMDLEES